MKSSFQKPIYIVYALAALLCASAFSVFSGAQTQKKQLSTDNYHRPAPTKPIKPTIPDVNRYQEDKVFLEYADSLFRPPHEYEEFQIVKGSVKFRQGGMWMFCDSAYYYPEKNSMDAFGHVEMRQGDTLFVYADKLYYDGLAKHAVLTKALRVAMCSSRTDLLPSPPIALIMISIPISVGMQWVVVLRMMSTR